MPLLYSHSACWYITEVASKRSGWHSYCSDHSLIKGSITPERFGLPKMKGSLLETVQAIPGFGSEAVEPWRNRENLPHQKLCLCFFLIHHLDVGDCRRSNIWPFEPSSSSIFLSIPVSEQTTLFLDIHLIISLWHLMVHHSLLYMLLLELFSPNDEASSPPLKSSKDRESPSLLKTLCRNRVK